MNWRIVVYALACLILLALVTSVSRTAGYSLALVDPTAQQQTIDAAVQQRFTQTAEALATAAFEATVDAVFYAAVTATAQAMSPAPAETPGGTVLPSAELDTEAFLNANFHFQEAYTRALCVSASGSCPAEVEAPVPCLTVACKHEARVYPVAATFETIQAASDAAMPGDLVIIMPGEYRGVAVEEKSGADGAYIHFRGWGEPGQVVVTQVADPSKEWLRDLFYFIDSSYYIIQGITFAEAPRAGLFFSGYFSETGHFASHIVVMDVYSHNNGVWGMHTTATSYMVVQDSVFANSREEHGLYQSGSGDNLLVRRNVFQNNYNAGYQMNADPQTAMLELFYWLENATGDTCDLSEEEVDYGGSASWDDVKACYDRQGLPDLGAFIEDGIGENIIVEQNVLTGNGAGGGAAINLASVRGAAVRNNLIYGNEAGGVACWDNAYADEKGLDRSESPFGCQQVRVVNNTIVDGEEAPSYSAVTFNSNARDMVAVNNIIARARDDAYEILDTSSQGLVSGYNYCYALTIENPELAVSLDADASLTGFTIDEALTHFVAPGFAEWVSPDGAWYRLNPERPDFRLAPASPLIDAGDPAYMPTLDLFGVRRVQAGIGALGEE